MKLYEPWEFCESINCPRLPFIQKDKKHKELCHIDCDVYKMHSYLRDHNQILEAGSELAKTVAEAERLRGDNEILSFKADAYTYLILALKELPDVLPQVLSKVNSMGFKSRFAKIAGLEG